MTMTTSSNNKNIISDQSNSSGTHQSILISLPLCDLRSKTSEKGEEELNLHEKDDAAFPNLLLLQLPTNDIHQFISCKTYLLGKESNENIGNDGSSSQACLVMEAPSEGEEVKHNGCCGKTFLLNRVETSNSLILIPHSTNSSTQEQNADKKQRTEGYTEQVGRLVNPSSFLEVKRKALNKQQLHDLLYQDSIARQKKKRSNHGGLALRPTSCTSGDYLKGDGYTIYQLALHLESSRAEVQEALSELRAFEIFRNEQSPSRFTFLCDETVQHFMRSIFATFVEHPDLVTVVQGVVTVPQMDCIAQVRRLVTQVEEESWNSDDFAVDSIIQYCLNSISTSLLVNADDKNSRVMEVNQNKVASHLAHEILLDKQKRSSLSGDDSTSLEILIKSAPAHCFWTVNEFQQEWNRRMPFISEQMPSLDLLKGIALVVKKGQTAKKAAKSSEEDTQKLEEQEYLLYFPERILPLDAQQRFEKIFAFREEWSYEELEPYILPLVANKSSDGSLTQAELLLKHTRVITKDDGSIVHRLRK